MQMKQVQILLEMVLEVAAHQECTEVLLAPLKGSCHATEVLLYLLLLPAGHCAEPNAWPLTATDPTLPVLDLGMGSLHLLPRPFDAPTQK